MIDEERTMEVPTDEDENVGDVPKKKVKKKKSKEERSADRKVVFWTLMIVLGITFVFWLWPRIGNMSFSLPSFGGSEMEEENEGSGWKNYVEYKL